jgi:hypothetical protein
MKGAAAIDKLELSQPERIGFECEDFIGAGLRRV